MRTKELKKKIECGFSELAPDMFDAIMLKIEQDSKQEQTLVEEPAQKQNIFKIVQRRMLPVSAGLAMVCMLALLIFPWKTNEISVVMKINPSIQMILNTSYEVIELKGLNQDGKDVVNALKWEKNEPIDSLMQTLLVDLTEKSYLKQDGKIQLTVSSKKKEVYYEVETVLEKEIEKNLTTLGYTGVSMTCQSTETEKKLVTEESEVPSETEVIEPTVQNDTKTIQTTPQEQKNVEVPKIEEKKPEEKDMVEIKPEQKVLQENKMPEETEKKPVEEEEKTNKDNIADENSDEKKQENSETSNPEINKQESDSESVKDDFPQKEDNKNGENKTKKNKDENLKNKDESSKEPKDKTDVFRNHNSDGKNDIVPNREDENRNKDFLKPDGENKNEIFNERNQENKNRGENFHR